MKFIDEFRNSAKARSLIAEIHRQVRKPVRLMEVCGTHTVAIARYGLRQVLPPEIELISGPGCPVCVTSQADIDRAVSLARLPGVIVTTFGDMVRVPGSDSTLAQERARGGDVRVIYSPLDAMKIAEESSGKRVVFLGVGFETTAPAVAATLLEACKRHVDNFAVFSAHKTIPGALKTLLQLGEHCIDGFLLPGHVSTIIGSGPYEFLPRAHGMACVISGFEPLDILQSILLLVRQIGEENPRVEIGYRRGVSPDGNARAQGVMRLAFEAADVEWRGLGMIPGSGLAIIPQLAAWDAARTFSFEIPPAREIAGCRCGEVLRGILRPKQCGLFAEACTPEHPLGPCMVSFEGSCAAVYKYEL